MLEHSPVPVVVVRPERKVQRDIESRRNDPKRNVSMASSKTMYEKPTFDRRQSDEPSRPKTANSSELRVPDREESEGKRGGKLKGVPLKKTRTAPG